MKRLLSLALLMTSISATAANLPQFNGISVKAPNAPAIYLVDQGCRRHIPNPATFELLFRDWSYYTGIDIYGIDQCTPISTGAHLAKCPPLPAVYLIDNAKKRHVASPAVMDKYNFDWNKIEIVSCNVLDAIPTGPTIY